MNNYIIINGQKINVTRMWNRLQQLEHRIKVLENERNMMNNEKEVKWPFHKAARFIIAITAIIWFFIIMLLSGCNENRPVRKGFVVDSYCTLDYDCRYFLAPLYYTHDVGTIFIRDSCGLYEKGDTLWFVNLSKH